MGRREGTTSFCSTGKAKLAGYSPGSYCHPLMQFLSHSSCSLFFYLLGTEDGWDILCLLNQCWPLNPAGELVSNELFLEKKNKNHKSSLVWHFTIAAIKTRYEQWPHCHHRANPIRHVVRQENFLGNSATDGWIVLFTLLPPASALHAVLEKYTSRKPGSWASFASSYSDTADCTCIPASWKGQELPHSRKATLPLTFCKKYLQFHPSPNTLFCVPKKHWLHRLGRNHQVTVASLLLLHALLHKATRCQLSKADYC